MSDDYTDTSNDRTVSRDDTREPGTAVSRIAIHARSQAVADALWQGIENRARKKGMIPVLRTQAGEADVGIYLLTGEDFADDETARATVMEILAGVAPRNILFEPQAASDSEINYRMTKALTDLAARPGYHRLASQEHAGANPVPYQARAILKLLQAKAAGPEPDVVAPAADSDQARKKALKRETRGSRKKGDAARTEPRKRAKKRAPDEPAPEATDPVTGKPATAPVGGADRAGKRAQKRAAKKAEKARRAAADPVAATAMVPSAVKGGKDSRAEKRARKHAAKGDKRAKPVRQKTGKSESQKDIAGPDTPATAGSEARAEKRAKRKALKKTAKKKGDATETVKRRRAGGEDAGAKTAIANSAAAEQKKPTVPSSAAEARPRALSLAVTGMGDDSRAALSQSLQRALQEVRCPIGLTISDKKRDIAIYAFDEPPLAANEIAQRAGVIAGDGARVRIFLERAAPSVGTHGDENRAIAGLAGACGGLLVRLASKFQRYGDGVMVANGQFTQAGWDLVAGSVLGILAARLPRFFPARPQPPAPPDLLDARAFAARAPEFLAQLGWSKSSAPKSLGTGASKAAMEPLIGEKLALPPDRTFDLRSPVAWPEEISDRVSAIQILGLEFLTGPLSYWYDKAGGRNSGQIAEIDAVLKDRQIKASEILSRAEKLMTGFVEKYPLGALPAWQEDAVSQRARVFTLYVLCCKMALKRRVRFDADAFAAVFLSLFDLIEKLRADDFYKPASAEGYEQDFLLIGLGLALRGTAYGDRLLADSLERFRQLQLEAGLTLDGVWRAGPFSEHGTLLSGLRVLMGDLDKSDSVALESFAAAAKKMTVFAEAMLKSNGQPPMIDGRKQKSYGRHLSGARLALAQAGGKSVAKNKIAAMPRLTDTYVFRDAQYFISHSTQKGSDDSSLVVLHADAASLVDGDPGGVTLVFARGETDLLIRAAPPELANKRDRSPLFDPALRNGYHVDGAGFAAGGAIGQGAARIVKSWRGGGWAAAKSVDEVNSAASVSRVVVHLKAVHALIVVDALESKTGTEHDFEQFWHIAPGLAAPSSGEIPLRFASAQSGGMSVAFDAQGETTIEAEGDGICVRRRERLAKGSLASLFQWSETAVPVAIEVAGGEAGGWAVSASGAGFHARLTLHGDEFVCEVSSSG